MMKARVWIFLLFTVSLQFAAAQETTVSAHGHVLVVALENHSYSDVVGSPYMPFFNSLLVQSAIADRYFANGHVSLSQYFMLATGKPITGDNAFSSVVTADNLARQLIAANKTWKVYAQALPSTGYLGDNAYPYVRRHNPFAFFVDVIAGEGPRRLSQPRVPQAQNLVPLTQLAADLDNNALPNFSFIIPDDLHNGHDCPNGGNVCPDSDKLLAADQWLEANIGPVLSNPVFQQDGLLVVWWDEGNLQDNTFGGGQIAVVFNGPKVRQGYHSLYFYRHEHLLRTMAEALGVGYPGASATAHAMTDMFVARTVTGTGRVTGTVVNAATGTPLQGAIVTNGPMSVTTDAAGGFMFDALPDGNYTFAATSPGMLTSAATVAVMPGAASNLSLRLAASGVISGTVTDSSGALVGGVAVRLRGGTIPTDLVCTTNAAGSFTSVHVPVGIYSISAVRSGYWPQSAPATITAGAISAVNFVLLALPRSVVPARTRPSAQPRSLATSLAK